MSEQGEHGTEPAANPQLPLENGHGEAPDNVTFLPNRVGGADRAEHLRILEAVLFAAAEPLDVRSLAARLPDGVDVPALLEDLQTVYAPRGVNLACVGGKWLFRTADDLAFLMRREAVEQKKLSRAAVETLAIIAYHQPVTRAEIEEIRGVAVSKGTLDVLMEATWVRIKGRRQTPGRPVTFGTTDAFMSHFGLEAISDLPGVDELKAAGLLNSEPPADFEPDPMDIAHARGDDDEVLDALEAEDDAEVGDFPEGDLEESPGETEAVADTGDDAVDPGLAEALAEEFADAAFKDGASPRPDGSAEP